MPFMFRWVEDDTEALRTADAMERAEATVLTITPNGSATFDGAREPHTKYIVWARVRDNDHIDRVDAAIEKEFEAED